MFYDELQFNKLTHDIYLPDEAFWDQKRLKKKIYLDEAGIKKSKHTWDENVDNCFANLHIKIIRWMKEWRLKPCKGQLKKSTWQRVVKLTYVDDLST